jgi:hypothetical protein
MTGQSAGNGICPAQKLIAADRDIVPAGILQVNGDPFGVTCVKRF